MTDNGEKPATAVATVSAATLAMRERIHEATAQAKERNALVAAIRGTQWSKDCSPGVQRAIAHYCLTNGLDPVRHVEVLGGRVYLTANFYDEKGLPFILDGTVVMADPDNVAVDARLDALAAQPTADPASVARVEWARGESFRRLQERIKWGIPDAATGAFVTRGTVAGSPVVGFNFCGGGTKQKIGKGGVRYDADPIGDKDPALTAQTRSRRRFWVQAVAALGDRAASIQAIEVGARIVDGGTGDLGDAELSAPAPAGHTPLLGEGRAIVEVPDAGTPDRVTTVGAGDDPYAEDSTWSPAPEPEFAPAPAPDVAIGPNVQPSRPPRRFASPASPTSDLDG